MSILVVECKQYRKASRKNFREALTDYANGRENARVVLVNYGSADATLLNGVPPSVKNRTSVIGDMRPGSRDAQTQFKAIVGETLVDHCIKRNAHSTDDTRLRNDSPMKITLSWGSTPRDLDLYARVLTRQGDLQVCFAERGSSVQAPWVYLDSDIRDGQGPETITIDRWIEGAEYCLAVHNYSNETPLADCGASVVLTQGTKTWNLECPSTGNGRWWSLLCLRTDSRQVEVVNRIVDAPW
jgi:hypothetical protein